MVTRYFSAFLPAYAFINAYVLIMPLSPLSYPYGKMIAIAFLYCIAGFVFWGKTPPCSKNIYTTLGSILLCCSFQYMVFLCCHFFIPCVLKKHDLSYNLIQSLNTAILHLPADILSNSSTLCLIAAGIILLWSVSFFIGTFCADHLRSS